MPKTDRAAEALAMRALELLPKNLVSRLFGAVAELELPRPLQLAVNEGFVRWKGLQMQEAERAASEYVSLGGSRASGIWTTARCCRPRGGPTRSSSCSAAPPRPSGFGGGPGPRSICPRATTTASTARRAGASPR